MGRATIISDDGAGLYTVDLHHDRTAADARVAAYQASAAATTARLPALAAAVATAQSALAAAAATASAAVAQYQAALATGDPTAIDTAAQAMGRAAAAEANASAAVTSAQAAHDLAQLEADSYTRKAAALESQLAPATTRAQLWCCDGTVGLSGDVGTLDVGRMTPVVIAPGHTGVPAWSGQTHGELVQRLSQTPQQWACNLAMLPGADKWRPRYRTGTLTDVDTATGLVALDLDPVTSPWQGLSVDQSAALADVPVEYQGSADPTPFSAGDDVVVRFDADPADISGGTSWSAPVVVGFVHDPPVASTWIGMLYDGAVLTPDGPGPWTVEIYGGYPDTGWWPYGYTGSIGSHQAHSQALGKLTSIAAGAGDAYNAPTFVQSGAQMVVEWPGNTNPIVDHQYRGNYRTTATDGTQTVIGAWTRRLYSSAPSYQYQQPGPISPTTAYYWDSGGGSWEGYDTSGSHPTSISETGTTPNGSGGFDWVLFSGPVLYFP